METREAGNISLEEPHRGTLPPGISISRSYDCAVVGSEASSFACCILNFANWSIRVNLDLFKGTQMRDDAKASTCVRIPHEDWNFSVLEKL